MKIDSVPSVTMKGGSFSRVTSRPLTAPAAVPTTIPIRIATGPGIPLSALSLALSSIARMEIAPTDRSMPAVRMISVWPIARAPTTATCCMISDCVRRVPKFGLR